MSLQVWLPLNGSLENKGLSDLQFSVEQKNYRYIRFVINAIRGGGGDSYTQLSRLEFIDESGNIYQYPSGTKVTTNMTSYPANESPRNIIDGNVNTKFCTLHTAGGYLTIDLGASNNINLNQYSWFQWYTANDAIWRDPLSFSIQFSTDGVNFKEAANINNAEITTSRHTLAYKGACYTSIAPKGKIGANCYSNHSTTIGGIISDKTLHIGDNLSMFAWVKLDEFNPTSLASLTGIGGMHTISHTSGTNYARGVGMGINVHTSGKVCFSYGTQDGSYRHYNNLTSINSITTGDWYHIGFTCKKIDNTTSAITIYINGNAEVTHNITNQYNPDDYVHLFSWSRDGAASTPIIFDQYKPKGQINDFRIYDHCLSPREIKLLAQGLVAHYKLESTAPNLLTNANKYTSSSPLERTDSRADGYLLTDMSSQVVPGRTYYFSCKTDGQWYQHNTSGVNPSNKYATVWFYLTYNYNPSATSWDGDVAIGTKCFTKAEGDGVWSFTIPEGYNGLIVRTNTYSDGTNPVTIKFWDFHLSDSTFITQGYDCSGYGNHGTCSTSFKYNYNSPRYKNCAEFENNKYISTPITGFNGIKNSYTFSWWSKITDMNQKMLFGFNGSTNATKLNLYPVENKFCWNQYNHADNPFNAYSGKDISVSTYSNGQWHHYTITGDGSSTLLYIDGDLKGKATTYVALPDAKLFISGNDASASFKWNNGQISDFRLYATALSETAVKELYQSSISFLDNGTLQCSEIVETNTNLKYNQNGIVQAKELNEIGYIDQMKIKTLSDGSAWARIHYLNVSKNPYARSSYFTDDNEINYCINNTNRFSLMQYVDYFKDKSNKYEFLLIYPSILPEGYTQLEYLEKTGGTQYINTGVKPTSNTRILLKGYTTGPYSIYGTNESGKMFNYTGSSGDNTTYFYWGSGGACLKANRFGQTNVLEQNKNIARVDNGSNNWTHTYSSASWTGTFPILLFARSNDANGANGDNGGTVRIYNCEIYENNEMIRHFIPCLNPSGTLGYYDVINNKFYSNNGSGSFVAGPVVNTAGYNRWSQTSSPNDSAVAGYISITNTWSGHNSGIRKHGTSCLYNCDSGGTWYAPIGQKATWEEGTMRAIPAANGNSSLATELWVRIDNLPKLKKLSMFNKALQAHQIYEL